jgi:hypothetical protein
MVSLDYQPSNPLRGQGTVGTASSAIHSDSIVRPRQVETDPLAKTDLFLSQKSAPLSTRWLEPVGIHPERFE